MYYCIKEVIQQVGMNFDNNVPIYLQLVEIMKNKIISGEFKSGERIPSVRELALIMKVNPNTVQKALVELENLNLIYTERTNGRFVTKDSKIINNSKKQNAKTLTNDYLKNMYDIGFSKDEIIEYIKGEI